MNDETTRNIINDRFVTMNVTMNDNYQMNVVLLYIIRILHHQVVLEGIFSQVDVEVAGVCAEAECSLPRDYGKLDSLVNEIVEDWLTVDALTVEYYST